MNATTRTEVVVTLELSQREALLLRALTNGMSIEIEGARSADEDMAASLDPGRMGLFPDERAELTDLISSLHSSLSEVTR